MMGSVTTLLEAYRLPLTVRQAVSYLDDFTDRYQLLYLFKTFFPNDYTNSTLRPFPEGNEAYSPKECEFFRLIDRNLFELQDLAEYEYATGSDSRSRQIYTDWLSVPSWLEDFTQLHLGFQVMLVLCDNLEPKQLLDNLDLYWEGEQTGLKGELEGMVQILAEAYPVKADVDALETLGQKLGTPLGGWAKAIDMLDHCTGNLWLDSTWEEPIWLEWSEASVRQLTEDYQKAKIILAEVTNFLDWMVENVVNLAKVVTWWNELHQPQKLPTGLSQPYQQLGLNLKVVEETLIYNLGLKTRG